MLVVQETKDCVTKLQKIVDKIFDVLVIAVEEAAAVIERYKKNRNELVFCNLYSCLAQYNAEQDCVRAATV